MHNLIFEILFYNPWIKHVLSDILYILRWEWNVNLNNYDNAATTRHL